MPLKQELEDIERKIADLEEWLGSWRNRPSDQDEWLDQQAQLVFMKEYRKILLNRIRRARGSQCK